MFMHVWLCVCVSVSMHMHVIAHVEAEDSFQESALPFIVCFGAGTQIATLWQAHLAVKTFRWFSRVNF